MRKEFQKWNITEKLFGGATDNDTAMVKAIRQLETNHIRCVAHTMQLAIRDGLKHIKSLIDAAKKLNNFIVNHDKYCPLIKAIFREINTKGK